MKLTEKQKNILRFWGNHVLSFFIDLLCKSLKISFENRDSIDHLAKENKNYVAAFWHGTMLIPWYIFRNTNFSAIVSKSKDGEILARQLKKWNYEVARGSSHKGGKAALELLINKAAKGRSIAITPDGPTGPPHKMKAGAVITAKKAKIPLLMVGVGIENKIALKSWDKFQIPKPFSRVKVIFSEPEWFNESLTRDEVSAKINDCERTLNELQLKAGKFD